MAHSTSHFMIVSRISGEIVLHAYVKISHKIAYDCLGIAYKYYGTLNNAKIVWTLQKHTAHLIFFLFQNKTKIIEPNSVPNFNGEPILKPIRAVTRCSMGCRSGR